jgi:hypothetical protein
VTRRARTLAAAVLALAAWPQAAPASDGVREISQSCAQGPGCFPGDPPGFPVRIAASGSYVLTSALSVQSANATAISIVSDDVTLDLNGFSITGPTTCSGLPPVCTPGAGTGSGVAGASAGRVTVVNGVVRGLGDAGIDLGMDARVEGVRASENGGRGISVGAGGSVARCSAQRNGAAGIAAGDDAAIETSTSSENGGDGIRAGERSTVRACATNANGDGIEVGLGSVVSASVAAGNRSYGFRLGEGSVLASSAATTSGSDGILAGAGSSIQDSVSSANAGFGLVGGSGDSGYAGNVIDGNGATVFTGSEVGTNLCDGSTTCP